MTFFQVVLLLMVKILLVYHYKHCANVSPLYLRNLFYSLELSGLYVHFCHQASIGDEWVFTSISISSIPSSHIDNKIYINISSDIHQDGYPTTIYYHSTKQWKSILWIWTNINGWHLLKPYLRFVHSLLLCFEVSCSGCISVSVPTTALR